MVIHFLKSTDKSQNVEQARSEPGPLAVTKRTHEKTIDVRKLSVISVSFPVLRGRQHTWKNRKESIHSNSRRKIDFLRFGIASPCWTLNRYLRLDASLRLRMLKHHPKKWLHYLPIPTLETIVLRTYRHLLLQVFRKKNILDATILAAQHHLSRLNTC